MDGQGADDPNPTSMDCNTKPSKSDLPRITEDSGSAESVVLASNVSDNSGTNLSSDSKQDDIVEKSATNSETKEAVADAHGSASSSSENQSMGDSSCSAEAKPNIGGPSSGAVQLDPSTLHYEGETCIYTDPVSKHQYQWDVTKNEWVARETAASYGYDGDTHTYTDPSDGTIYMWDRDKNAWFPKIDDDFMAIYQMNYGFTDPKVAAEEAAKAQKEREEKELLEVEKKLKRKAEPQPPTWFELDNEHNTKVYVSNLPLDITEQEFVDVMQKCGMVMRDVDTNKMKVKLYTEPGSSTRFKGDALCSYIKIESVELALNLLDGYEIRGKKISVERAKFQMKGSYNPSLKPKKKRKKDKEKLKKQQERLFDWRPEKMRGERSKHERVVIIKNLFDPTTFEKEVSLILEFQQDLREECAKCGNVRRVVIYDRHPEGVAQVTFSDPEEADICIKLLNGRWFGQRKITAESWDGKTKYKVLETEAETKARLEKWDKFLELEELRSHEAADKTAKPELKMSDLMEATGGTEADAEETEPAEGEDVERSESDSAQVKEVTTGSA